MSIDGNSENVRYHESVPPKPPHDAEFEKYAQMGAYHWREVGGHWLYHNAYTAERYRRVLSAAEPLEGLRVVDYGCGDGALLGMISRSVGEDGEAVGFDPNPDARKYAGAILKKKSLPARLVALMRNVEAASCDRVICSEVIEHVHDPDGLLDEIHRVLKPGGRSVLTTPIRMTETPEDPNHIREWFPSEFQALIHASRLKLIHHEEIVPAATPEVFFWRPRFTLRVPVFRILCNILSIYGKVNALTWLGMRPRLFMTQLVVVSKP